MSSAHSGWSSLRVNHSLGGREGDDGVRAEIADSAEDVFIEAVDERADGDDGGDADDDAENGERRAERVFAQGVESEQDLVFDFERACGFDKAANGARARLVQSL